MLWADRGDPDAVSIGDEACLSFRPDLLRFLEADLGGGLKLGEGFAARWILPLTAAASASYYLASPRGRETLNGWQATRARLVWTRPCADGETVEAHARIAGIGRSSMRFEWRIVSAAGHDLLAEGELIYVSRDGAGARPPVRRLHAPVVVERQSEARGAMPQAVPAEIYYVARDEGHPTTRERATTAADLMAPARALLAQVGGDDPYAACARCEGSPRELRASLERRLLDCVGPGVRILCGPGGGSTDLHVRYLRALHPRVRVATATEAVLAFLDCHTPQPLAVALPASHRRGDGLLWQHPVLLLGRGIPITPEQPHRGRLAAAWWAPGEVRAMEVRLDGVVVARHMPAGDEPPSIEFLAERATGYELHVEVREAALARAPLRPSERTHDAEAGRFVEWPAEPFERLAAFEAPFLVEACRARAPGVAPGDCWAWVYPAGLLRLLYHPIGGGTEPVGRRAHPLGAIAAAASVHASAQALGDGWTPHEVRVRWRRPIDPLAGFLVRARAGRCGPREIAMECRLEQPPAALADVSLVLRAAGGRA